MAMSKKVLFALADAIKDHNRLMYIADQDHLVFSEYQLNTLADFCRAENCNFKRERWLDYIAGKCGSNGGSVKAAKRRQQLLEQFEQYDETGGVE